MVADILNGMLRDHIVRGKGVFSSTSYSSSAAAAPRPVLVLLDRGIDLAVGLQHASTYQALVDDLLGLPNRRVTIPAFTPDGRQLAVPHVYDLDVTRDTFWNAQAGTVFGAARVRVRLHTYASGDSLASSTGITFLLL